MPNKRRNRGQTKIYCAYCEQRMWRLGSQKYFLCYQNIVDLQKNVGINRKTASFLLSKSSAYVDRNSWLEEFFCEEHGKMWMRLSQKPDGTLVPIPAKSTDWHLTSNTINPDLPNPSVSEFTYRMSRGICLSHES